MSNDWLRYQNQGATRNRPLDPRLVQALGFAPSMGLNVEVFSGGQPSAAEGGRRTGSVRHDHGGAADVFFSQNGRRLDWANPQDRTVFQDIVRKGKAAGITGFGAGDGYMQRGSMHVGFGSPGVWGAGGQGSNAPSWLREAYGSPGNPARAAAAAPASGVASMTSPTPIAQQMVPSGPAPQVFGDIVGQNTVQATAAPMQNFGDVAAAMMQGQQQRQAAQAEQEAAEQQRKAALFGDNLFGPFA